MNIRGSQTEKNLYKTFAGESRARNKYTFYAEAARCEGYRWVAEIFEETAENEKAHARETFKRFLKKVRSTEYNLEDAIKSEAEEHTRIYKDFEETAQNEGFEEIAVFYKELREVEENHEKRFRKLLEMIIDNKMFKSNEDRLWQCMNCGYIHEGNEAPESCPLCKYPKEYFKQYCEIK